MSNEHKDNTIRWFKDERVLLCRREDGKFLKLYKSPGATSAVFVDDPLKAEHVTPSNPDEYRNPKLPTYYFENPIRMETWLQSCEMVSYSKRVTMIQQVKP